MAFTTAPGHTNLPQGNFSPTIYSQKIQKAFRTSSVVEAITNNDYYGEIANYGDSVEIIKEPTITVTDYVRGQTLTSSPIIDDKLTLTINKANMFQFEVDDIEHKHSHVNFAELATSNAAYQLKKTFDTEVLSYMAGAAGVTSTLGNTAAAANLLVIDNDSTVSGWDFSPLGLLNRIQKLFDENDVPEEDRWFVASPAFYEKLGDENSKYIEADTMGRASSDSQLINGMYTNRPIRGFKAYKSNNLPTGTVGGTDYVAILAGHRSAVATAQQIAKKEAFRSPTKFADVFRGLHLYGRGVLRAEALAVAYMSLA